MYWFVPQSEAVARDMDSDGFTEGSELPVKQTPPGPGGESGEGVNRAQRWYPENGLVGSIWAVNYVNYPDGQEPPFAVFQSVLDEAEAEALHRQIYP